MTREEFEEMMTPTFLIFGEKLEEARRIANDSLSRFEPVYVVIASISCWIMLSLAWRLVCSFYDLLAEQGLCEGISRCDRGSGMGNQGTPFFWLYEMA